MKKTDPEKFVEAYNKGLRKDYPFERACWGVARDAATRIGMLEEGLCEFRDLLAGLKTVDKLEWVIALVNSVSKLEPEIISFLAQVEKDAFSLFWRIEGEQATPSLRLLYEQPMQAKQTVFKTDHSKSISETVDWNRTRLRPITVKDITSAAQEKIREHLETGIQLRNGMKE